MAVDLDKVRREAPHMVDLVKEVGISLEKNGLNPQQFKAAVIATFDHSGSTEFFPNSLYSDGTMQRLADIMFAAGLQLDDDGEVPVSIFDDSVNDLGSIELHNCKGFIAREHKHYGFGGTNYMAALRWIVESANCAHVSLEPASSRFKKFFGRSNAAESHLRVRATAPYPTLALFVTDGEPDPGTEQEIIDYLTLMSQLPIFVQFIGVGRHSFRFLRKLDEMDGRFVDNANFFDAKSAKNTEDMLQSMLGEFPSYYQKARQLGLLV
jgi:hypothetical protein